MGKTVYAIARQLDHGLRFLQSDHLDDTIDSYKSLTDARDAYKLLRHDLTSDAVIVKIETIDKLD